MQDGNTAVSSITRELSAYIAGALKKPLPKDVFSGERKTVWRIEKVADIRALRPLLRA